MSRTLSVSLTGGMERAPTELKHGFVENAILVLLIVAFNANNLTLS